MGDGKGGIEKKRTLGRWRRGGRKERVFGTKGVGGKQKSCLLIGKTPEKKKYITSRNYQKPNSLNSCKR